jgi:hypothetical protein
MCLPLQVLVFPIPIPMPAAILGVFWVASDISGSIRVGCWIFVSLAA